MCFEINSLGSFQYLDTAIPTRELRDGRLFLDLSSENQIALINFGKGMELSNYFESMKRWLWTTKIGRCFGGDKRIFKMAQKKIKEVCSHANIRRIIIDTKYGFRFGHLPSPQEMQIKGWIKTSSKKNFPISIQDEKFTISNCSGGTLSVPLSSLQIPEDCSLQERLKQLAPDCEFTLLAQSPEE